MFYRAVLVAITILLRATTALFIALITAIVSYQ